MLRRPHVFVLLCLLVARVVCPPPTLSAGPLYVGGATVSITPDQPVALDGLPGMRISRSVLSPCTATALALETRDGEQTLGQVIFVSCDLIGIRGGVADLVREELRGRLPDSLLECVILNATHTHTGPVLDDGKFDFPEEGVMLPAAYREFLVKRLGDLIVEAWEKRAPAQVAWGLGHAVVATNRRAMYANGKAVMYGKTDQPDFRGMEGYEDHGLELLYFWDADDKLIATAVNVAAPSQELGGNQLSADFWHPVREMLRRKHGDGLLVLAWAGAAGDQATRPQYRKAAEQRMIKLRGSNSLNEQARRIVSAWEEVYEVVREDRQNDVVLEHRFKPLQLPHRRITEAEVGAARLDLARWERSDSPSAGWNRARNHRVIERYEKQQHAPQFYSTEVYVVRLGDVAIATNTFELFTDFGVQMKARSPALQTFVIQLCGPGRYVPTERSTAAGGYGATVESNVVGAEGGQILVEETMKQIKTLWPSQEKTP